MFSHLHEHVERRTAEITVTSISDINRGLERLLKTSSVRLTLSIDLHEHLYLGLTPPYYFWACLYLAKFTIETHKVLTLRAGTDTKHAKGRVIRSRPTLIGGMIW